MIITDKAPSILDAFKKLQKQGKYKKTEHCRIKYLNNLVEQDLRKIKMRSKTYKYLRVAPTTVKGMETVHALNEVTNLLAS